MRERDHSGNGLKPLIVFAGRSNVGKSSTIRALTGIKVKIGKRPGSTRWEQFIELGPVDLVDIPGFGYMSGQSKKVIEDTKTMIVQKLERWSDRIVVSILIIDISLFQELVMRWEKRGEIPIDIEFYTFLSEISQNVIVVANKIDKLKVREVEDALGFLELKLLEVEPTKKPEIIGLSATKRRGVRELAHMIESKLSDLGYDKPSW
jgi:GTP-binding protein EngB required for normal cell division